MGYTNNFGESTGAGTKEGVQTEIISFTFKKLVTKMMDQMPALVKPENMSLCQDMRHFLSFIHSSHGNTFRKVVVSGLLLSIPTTENYKIQGKCYSRSVQRNIWHSSPSTTMKTLMLTGKTLPVFNFELFSLDIRTVVNKVFLV